MNFGIDRDEENGIILRNHPSFVPLSVSDLEKSPSIYADSFLRESPIRDARVDPRVDVLIFTNHRLETLFDDNLELFTNSLFSVSVLGRVSHCRNEKHRYAVTLTRLVSR